ncbi:conserved hypothetical protein, partial [Trichophyton verrucosum HKI 0517]
MTAMKQLIPSAACVAARQRASSPPGLTACKSAILTAARGSFSGSAVLVLSNLSAGEAGSSLSSPSSSSSSSSSPPLLCLCPVPSDSSLSSSPQSIAVVCVSSVSTDSADCRWPSEAVEEEKQTRTSFDPARAEFLAQPVVLLPPQRRQRQRQQHPTQRLHVFSWRSHLEASASPCRRLAVTAAPAAAVMAMTTPHLPIFFFFFFFFIIFPPRQLPPAYYLQQLESFASPVPDLAATLMSNPEDEIHSENVHFLRSRRRSSTELSPSRARTRRRQLGGGGGGGGGGVGVGAGAGMADSPHDSVDFGGDQYMPRSHQQYTSGHGQRIPIIRRRGAMNISHGPAYEGPPQQSNRIYSWAPTQDEEGGLYVRTDPLHPRDEIWFDRSASSSSRDEDGSLWSHLPRELRGTAQLASESPPEEQEGGRAVGAPNMPLARDNPALVTAAILQSVRRNHRYSPRVRTPQNQMQDDDGRDRTINASTNGYSSYNNNSSTSNNNNNNNDFATPFSFSPQGRRSSPRLSPPARIDTSRNSDIRRMYLKDPSIDRLREAIQYLDRVRFSNSYEESLSTAAAGGFVQFEYFLRNEDDFILDTGSIAGPGYCSWLSPGTVFSGQQQATASTAMLPHRLLGTTRPSTESNAASGAGSRISVYTSSGRSYWASNIMGNSNSNGSNNNSSSSSQDPEPAKTESWPVK